MKKLIPILFLLFSFLGYSQESYTALMPEIAWSTYLENVVYLSQDTFSLDVWPEDLQEPGAFPLEYGNYVIDNRGFRYKVISEDSGTLTVVDVFESGFAPAINQIGYVYKAAGDWEANSIPTIMFEKLDSKAFDYGYRIDVITLSKGIEDNSTRLDSLMPFDYIDFDTTLTDVEYKKARLYYDNERDNLVFYDANNNVSLDIGKELWVDVYNPSDDTILDRKSVV